MAYVSTVLPSAKKNEPPIINNDAFDAFIFWIFSVTLPEYRKKTPINIVIPPNTRNAPTFSPRKIKPNNNNHSSDEL